MDNSTTIQSLRQKVKSFNQARDWEQFHTPQDLAVSISIEAAELLDIFRWEIKKDIDQQKLDKIKEELADIIIYSLGLANSIDADISTIVHNKLKINEKKYPIEKAAGTSKKYSEL